MQQSLGRREDRYALEALQREQVVVARYDEFGLGGDGQREHLIVIGVNLGVGQPRGQVSIPLV